MALTDPAASTDARVARFERALISSNDGFWEQDLRSGVRWYSERLRAMLGLASDAPLDDAAFFARHIHPDDADAVIAMHQRAIATLESFSYEARYRDRDGAWRWMRGRGRAWPGADGRAEVLSGALSDRHEEKLAQLEQARTNDRLEHAVAAANAGVYERMLDRDESFVSERLWALLGYAPGELPARRSTFIELVHPDDRDRYLREAQAAIEVLGRLSAVARMRVKSGEYRWFRQDALPHRMPDGRLRVVGVLADIHEQTQARLALERAVAERTASLEAAFAAAEQRRSEAERANAAKSRFLAHMSHEIRTPLNGVLGLTDLALRSAVEPTQRRFLEVALQSGQTLLSIINDVLEVSRVEAGSVRPADEPFDIADALAEVMRGVMPLVGARGLAVRYDWTGGRTWVRGDAARVRQIATNLLGNAVKFTEHGHVQLIGAVEDSGAGRCLARVRFEDSGPGLDAQQLARVFDAFEQGDDSLSRRHGGTGLGLAIARGLAQALGGSIDVASEPGQGATFTLELPFGIADDPRPLPLSAPGRAWLVYTTIERGAWMKRRIERLGWSAEVVLGVDSAAAHAREAGGGAPQLVVVDHAALHAGVALDMLRAALPGAAITLLVRPDWSDPAVEARARALGMSLLVLPLTPRDLAAMGAASARAAQPSGGAPADGAAAPVPGALPGHVLLVEDNPVNQLIGVEVLRSLGLEVRTADDGAAALDACIAEPPALVLMDLQMPVMDGLEATRRLRSMQIEARLPKFPIVALTAHALDRDREQALAAGIDAYLTKPIVTDVLRGELARWLPALRA